MEYQDSERARYFVDEALFRRNASWRVNPKFRTMSSPTFVKRHESKTYTRHRSAKNTAAWVEFQDVLPLFEEAGRSLLAPLVMRVYTPDEGDIHTLELAGTENQQERWLQLLLRGELTSAFAMTEPRQGGGADPKMIKTTAEKDDDEWAINGHKWCHERR